MRTFIACFIALSWTAAGLAADLGPETVLPASPKPAHQPQISYGDGKYLVVWQSGIAEAADIYGCRVDESGKAIDAKPFLISGAKECQERPRVAWGKGSWLVVWEDVRNDKDLDVYAARVSADGKCLDPDGILVAGGDPASPNGSAAAGHNQCTPDAAFNGENFFVVWRSYEGNRYLAYGVRVSAEGRLLDSKPLALSPGFDPRCSVGPTRVASAGGKWMACWTRHDVNPGSVAPSGPGGLYVAVVTADGKATMSLPVKNAEMDNVKAPVTVASNGKDGYFCSWGNFRTGGRSGPASGMPYGAARCDLDGKVTGTTELGGKKVMMRLPASAWDGKGYLVINWLGSRKSPNEGFPEHTNKVVAHLVAADGKYEGATEVSSGKPNPAYAPAACGDGKGNTLVVWERHPADADPLEASIVIAARLVRR